MAPKGETVSKVYAECFLGNGIMFVMCQVGSYSVSTNAKHVEWLFLPTSTY